MADEPVDEDPEVTEPVTEEPSPEPVEAPHTPPEAEAVPASHKKRNLIIGLVVAVLIVLGGGYMLVKHHSKKPAAKVLTAHQVAKPKVNTSAQFVDNYLPSPIDLSPRPNLFSDYKGLFGTDCSGEDVDYTNAAAVAACPASVAASDIIYKQIGTSKAGKAIIIVDNGGRGEGDEHFVALKTGANTYSILGKYDYSLNQTQYVSASQVASNAATFKKELDPSTSLDLTTTLPDLVYPPTFILKGTSFGVDTTTPYASTPASATLFGYPLTNGLGDIRGGSYGSIAASKINAIGKVGAKTVYSVTAASDTNYALDEVYLGVNADHVAPYLLQDGFTNRTSNAAAPFSWSDGTFNKDAYFYRLPGCGSFYGYTVARGVTSSDLKAVGTSPEKKRTIYELNDNAPLLQEIYNNDYGSGSDLENGAYKNLTLTQFQAKHVVVLVKNGLGQYVVYIDDNYFMGGGCGKPVVYLYPTKTELVNVSVAADVKKSDPLYGSKGWRNVLARPNGQLTYQGANYPNLYWEGTGDGVYPAVSDGTVVTNKDAVATIRKQLSQQGLTTSETNDFLAYWQPRLPKTPYVRLTWFNTEQMNQLAPLSVSPKPDTLIRVFLDFQGLNHKASVSPQHFSAAPARAGFTVVEWGGLDRSDH